MADSPANFVYQAMRYCARAALAAGLVVSSVLGCSQAVPAAPTNTMTITDKSGSTQTNYPLHFGRPFVQGEIANDPQVVINGSPVLTQADVKNRWPDGSVKFAIISVIVPSIPANGTLKVSFQNQTSGNHTPLTQADMLAANFNFDAVMLLANAGVTKAASARAMLQNGDFTYWTQGPVATTIILADHGAKAKYDVGWDQYKPVRPIFEATFFPAINKVHVRYIGENANSKNLEDVVYSLVLLLGQSRQQVYSNSTVKHYAGTRWTKDFWIGGAPQNKINIDFNLSYLKETLYFPNYDTTMRPSQASVAGDYSEWTRGWAAKHDLYQPGFYRQDSEAAGGGYELAQEPNWAVKWLYTGDWREREISLISADLAGSWQMHVREADPSKKFDRNQTKPGLGKPISIYAHPTLWLFDGRDPSTPKDAVPIHGTQIIDESVYPTTNGGWGMDTAHQPNAFTTAYVLTGDYWYLEQMQLWAARDALIYDPNVRGPGGAYAGLWFDETRGNAWVFRNRMLAHWLTPDADPLKPFFLDLINDAISQWEGMKNLTGTSFSNNAEWKFGRHLVVSGDSGPVSPLGFWQFSVCRADGNDLPDFTAQTECISPLWQNYFLLVTLGRAKEMGYPVQAVLTWMSKLLLGQFTASNYNRKMVAAYETPSSLHGGDPTYGTPITQWSDVQGNLSPASQANIDQQWREATLDVQDGYGHYAAAAAAYLIDLPGGQAAWNWLKTNVRDPNASVMADNPKWAIIPRTDASAPTGPPGPASSR